MHAARQDRATSRVTQYHGFILFIRRKTMALDVVCGMEVDEATAQWTSEYKGETYYFCAPGCKASFDKDPEQYLSSAEDHDHDHDHGHDHHAGHEHH
jgi:YHS domain-containing protein